MSETDDALPGSVTSPHAPVRRRMRVEAPNRPHPRAPTPDSVPSAIDPLAGASARFPTARPHGLPPSMASPSVPGVRPWGLRHARVDGSGTHTIVVAGWRYDPRRQVAVDAAGTPITAGSPTAVKNTSNDGDEGPSEDFSYDFCPDEPGGV